MGFAQRLAQWVCEFHAASVAPRVQQQAKLLLLDSLGCAFAALDEPTAQATLRAIAAMGGTPECTVIGAGVRTSVANAVLANGVLIRTLDVNDFGSGPRTSGHPSDNIAVALAVGERHGCSGRDVLAAIVLGYELYNRMPPSLAKHDPWDGVSKSAIVAACMAGWLQHLPVEALANAIALSVSHCNTLSIVRRGQLSAAKSIANSMVTHTAMVATLLAAEGVTGPPTAMEEWADAVLAGADLSALVAPLDGEFRIMEVSIKAYPSLATSQAAVAAAIQLHSAIAGPLNEVEKIDVRMADIPFVSSQVYDAERRNPTTRETADHSFPFLIAAALLDGELTLRQFEHERWFDPSVRALMGRMMIETDEGLNRYGEESGYPCAISVLTKDGREHRAEVPYHRGHAKNKMDAGEVQTKFNRYAAPALSEPQRKRIIQQMERLETLPSLQQFMPLLAAR